MKCPPNALAWAEQKIDQTIIEVSQLAGSTSSTLFHIKTIDGPEYVLRLFTLAGWVKAEPDLARHEAAVLERVSDSVIPAPHPIAFDEFGDKTTYPAILMSKVPGSVELNPINLNDWLEKLGATLAECHRLPAENFEWSYVHWFDLNELVVPKWSNEPQAFRELINFLHTTAPEMPIVLLHRDYHPTNVLWQDGEVSGVVDWPNGCVGPAMVDVAHCRLNLVSLYGVEAAERFLNAWQNKMDPGHYALWWDICGLANGDVFGHKHGLYEPWFEFGKTDLTIEIVSGRLDAYAKNLAEKL